MIKKVKQEQPVSFLQGKETFLFEKAEKPLRRHEKKRFFR